METKFNFKSQIATSREQSEKLLALGLKRETADMVHTYLNRWDGYHIHEHDWSDISCDEQHIPAWSLHRLLCLYGLDYTIKEVYNNAEECYGMLICAIEIAIEDGDFNEEYLEKQWE